MIPSLAERICEETKTLGEFPAREALEFVGFLKHRGAAARDSLSSSDDNDDWAEFEKLAGVWSGKFGREACYDRPNLR